MSEESATPAVDGGETTVDAGQDTPEKMFSQSEMDEIIKSRLAREREKYKDYSDLKKFRESNLSETEKAISAAHAKGKAEAQVEYASLLAGAEIRAALTGLVENPDLVVEDLNLSRFITDDFTVDKEAITALREKYSAMTKQSKPRDVGHGRAGAVTSSKDPKSDFGKLLGLT